MKFLELPVFVITKKDKAIAEEAERLGIDEQKLGGGDKEAVVRGLFSREDLLDVVRLVEVLDHENVTNLVFRDEDRDCSIALPIDKLHRLIIEFVS